MAGWVNYLAIENPIENVQGRFAGGFDYLEDG